MQAKAVRTCLCLGSLWSSLQQHQCQLRRSPRGWRPTCLLYLVSAAITFLLGTVELTDSCTLHVRVGAAIDMLGPGRAVRGRARYNSSQKSWFQALPNVLSARLASPI